MSKAFMKYLFSFILIISSFANTWAAQLIIPMDDAQKNHLKAYGIAYWVLDKDVSIEWLLNYRGGSFTFPYHSDIEKECILRGVSYEMIADAQYVAIIHNLCI